MSSDIVVVVESDVSVVTVSPTADTIVGVVESVSSVVSGGEQGPAGGQGIQGIQGIQGVSGDVSFSYPAAGAISGHRIVTLDDQGKAVYASAEIPAHSNRIVGMTTNAAAPGDDLSVKKFGEVTEPSWNWQLDQPVYLAADGFLTQTPPAAPASKFSVVVGFPISATTLFIDIGISITLTH